MDNEKTKYELVKLPAYQMETKNYTLGAYDYSEVQQNVITLIQEQLKAFMTKDAHEAELRVDSMGEPYVVIDCNRAVGGRNKQKVMDELDKMFAKPISFRWRHPTWNKNIKTTCVIVTGYHDIEGTSTIKVNYNRWAIPFLIWYGRGVGGTIYDKTIALTLAGKYTKRIFKLVCSYRDKTSYSYDIETFRKDFALPASYKTAQIKKILNTAKADIDATNSDVTFDWEFEKIKEGKKKPKAKAIKLYPHWKKTRENMTDEDQKLYYTVYSYVGRIGVESSNIVQVCDLLLENQLLTLVVDKYNYYDDKITKGERMQNGQPYNMTILANSMKKLIREELEKKGVDPRKISFLYPRGQNKEQEQQEKKNKLKSAREQILKSID